MLKGRGRASVPGTPTTGIRSLARPPIAKPEPDYEVVEFPSEQYVNAKLQPPPPPPPRPPTGHPMDTSCGLCGGGGARVRCIECGRRALCASCDDMYHRHPKRRNHQRQALPPSQLKEERPPLPPKGTPPVPPPRRHKLAGDRSTASPKPHPIDPRRGTLNVTPNIPNHFAQSSSLPHNNFAVRTAQHNPNSHVGMPNFAGVLQPAVEPPMPQGYNSWGRTRASLPGYNVPPQNIMPSPQMEHWEGHENLTQNWGRPLRRGASVMELGGAPCAGCAHCANPWRYGSCANLEHSWGQGQWPQGCCVPQTHNPRLLPHPHMHPPQTPQPYRRVSADSRCVSRTASRAHSRAPSPALSMRSRASRRKQRSPTPSLPSSDADSESEPNSDRGHREKKPEKGEDRRNKRREVQRVDKIERNIEFQRDDKKNERAEDKIEQISTEVNKEDDESGFGPAPPPPTTSWQCEHCTFVNEPGVRVCVVCCRTPIISPKIITSLAQGMEKLTVAKMATPSPVISRKVYTDDANHKKERLTKERISTGSGPSPPKETPQKNLVNRLETPTREKEQKAYSRHDIAVGPSPPKDIQNQINQNTKSQHTSVERETYKQSIAVGSSPPRSSPITKTIVKQYEIQKKSVGVSPPRERTESRNSRTNVSNTGTSPPPQNISTQTYDEVPTDNWVRPASVTRSRPRRRFREDRRDRSQSRHSLSSDTRESERSARTTGGRWEWRDSSPTADWSESERKRTNDRLTRRASHLDLRRTRPSRRTSLYGSEAPSPEPLTNNRAISLEALAGAHSKREAERGLELARLMSEAERLGFSAAEVQAALAQNPVAPLAWLRERWPSLVAGVRAAAARLAAGINVTDLEARAALARHRGAMWPAVTECVERHRRQPEIGIGEEGKLRGRVWGSPVGADDEAAPPSLRSHRSRANSSDEFEESVHKFQDDDWMYLPLNLNINTNENEQRLPKDAIKASYFNTENIAEKLKLLLDLAGIPSTEESLLMKGLHVDSSKRISTENKVLHTSSQHNDNLLEFVQSEKDFIDAYNALTRLSPLPNIEQQIKNENHSIVDNVQHLDLPSDDLPHRSDIDSSVETTKHLENYHNISTNNENEINNNNNVNEPIPSGTKQDTLSSTNLETSQYNILVMKNTLNKEIIEKQSVELQDTKSNLSDLVDNTQRLIQQMKDEINFDITSNQDSEQTDTSRTEDSELSDGQESSYSDSENNTEEVERITSDGDESSSDEEFKKAESIKNKHSMTSSEDTEQFEEAMDYAESPQSHLQINSNTVHSYSLNSQNDNPDSVGMKTVSTVKVQREDVNNNLFTVVNSFEEMYEQLTSENYENRQNRANNISISKNNIKMQPNKVNKYTLSQLTKDTINVMDIKMVAPSREITLEIRQPVMRATIGEICEQKDLGQIITRKQEKSELSHNAIEDTTEINAVLLVSNEQSRTSHENEQITKYPDNNNIEDKPSIDLNKTIDFTSETQKNENKSKPSLAGKSNIPVPIKTIPDKDKLDTKQKTIVSKLPVRRSSIKVYPAPAPPKAQFATVQNGNVKQLQSKLLVSNQNESRPVVADPKPSTSTLKKKAPQPPKSDKQSSAKNSKDKEQYFRETCRTEDEWTDSESEDDKSGQKMKEMTPTPEIPPPPPITMRRISGKLIDLARIQLPEGSPERQARMLLAEGATENWDQARIAVEIIARGTDVPTAILAALECADLTAALAYLNQYCELCAAYYPEHEMVSMLRCSHRCCRECARHYFTVQITERSVVDCVCAYCKEPELEDLDEDAWVDYFAHLDILLKTLLENDVHELFQRKLRDRTLARDPNFRWCVECSSGCFVNPKQRKLRCPECKSVTCATCRKPWSTNHDGITCEEYETWLADNDPERSIAAVQQHLKENGLECPRCRFKYSLSRGGCMHFTCTQCKYEFCYGCGKPFTMGARCGLSEYCAKLGLHSHHPRNCLFYLRDKEPHELQTLLQMNNVAFESESPPGGGKRCPIQLQRETPTGLVDTTCGCEVLPKNAGLCKMHYVEYLAGLARTLDPIPIMEVSELVAELRRRALPLPERGPWDTDPIYAGMCAEIVKEKIPLD